MLQVSVYRYNPETDEKPWMQDIQVDTGGKDLMVLDVLELLKAQDPSLTYRRSCREGVCGSDGMNMNGKNGLGCITPLSQTVKADRLVLRPLPGLPVIRDLVVDMTMFYQQYEKVKPYLMNEEPAPAIERLQSPEERAKLLENLPLEKFTHRTITDLDLLESELERIVSTGYAIDNEEYVLGVSCVAVPVRDGEGEVVDDDAMDEAVEMYFHFDKSHMEDIQNGISLCLEQLGEYREALDNFFERQESYSHESIAKELGISVLKVDKLLPPYARLILGLKIEHCVGENGECNFEAEL
jgi:hypothetical protein